MSPSSIPMKLAAYMSSTRNLCLLNVKFDLRHLILEKTSVQVDHPSKLFFERLKLAKSREKDEDSGNESDQEAEPRKVTRKEKQKQQDFMFVQAYEQIKDMDLA